MLYCLRHVLALLALAWWGSAPAAPVALLDDYTHTAWGGLQGGPVDVVKIAQTTDGWLWAATETGLYRYDGVTFEHTDTVYGRRLASGKVLGLAAAADGALWVGYHFGGVSVFRKNGAQSYGEREGMSRGPVYHIAVAPDGTVWVGAGDGVATLAPGAARFSRSEVRP